MSSDQSEIFNLCTSNPNMLLIYFTKWNHAIHFVADIVFFVDYIMCSFISVQILLPRF